LPPKSEQADRATEPPITYKMTLKEYFIFIKEFKENAN